MLSKKSGKKTRKINKKKYYKRSYQTVVVRGPYSNGGFPLVMRTKHQYCDHDELDNHLNNTVVAKSGPWNLNDLYDPYYPTGGHQPLGRDQMAEAYHRYFVTGGKMQMWFFPYGDASNSMIPVGVAVTRGTSTADTSDTLMEQGSDHVRYKWVVTKESTGNRIRKLTYKWDAKTEFNYKDFKDAMQVYSKDVGVSPDAGDRISATIWAGDTTQLVSCNWFAVAVKITFYTTWSDPKMMSQS